MTNPSEIKTQFHARLEAADARESGFRQKLLDDGTRALQPVLGVLTLMAEVLDERENAHGSLTGLECEIDKEDFVCLRATLRGTTNPEQRIVIKFGPELGGRNLISVSGIGQKYGGRLSNGNGGAASSLERSVGSDLQLDVNRGADLAEVVREMVEDYFAGQAAHHVPPVESHARYAAIQ